MFVCAHAFLPCLLTNTRSPSLIALPIRQFQYRGAIQKKLKKLQCMYVCPEDRKDCVMEIHTCVVTYFLWP